MNSDLNFKALSSRTEPSIIRCWMPAANAPRSQWYQCEIETYIRKGSITKIKSTPTHYGILGRTSTYRLVKNTGYGSDWFLRFNDTCGESACIIQVGASGLVKYYEFDSKIGYQNDSDSFSDDAPDALSETDSDDDESWDEKEEINAFRKVFRRRPNTHFQLQAFRCIRAENNIGLLSEKFEFARQVTYYAQEELPPTPEQLAYQLKHLASESSHNDAN